MKSKNRKNTTVQIFITPTYKQQRWKKKKIDYSRTKLSEYFGVMRFNIELMAYRSQQVHYTVQLSLVYFAEQVSVHC
jgi:hypothetical protein